MRVLITGFGPFPGAPFNPSARLAAALAQRRRPAYASLKRSAHIFATTYASVDRDLPALLAQKPDIVLMFGLAARRRRLYIETRARNAVSVFPDASRRRPPRRVIALGAPAAVRGNAAFNTLLGAARASGLPAQLSRDAGNYLCNYAYWRALERADGGSALVQFVHIPLLRPKRKRRRGGHSGPTFSQLVATAERLLIALIAARRR
jgi:pyroglutamyl-peptidase